MRTSIHPVVLRWRLFRRDGNPLRRRSDRFESVFVWVAALLVAVSLWPAVVAGRAAHDDAVRDERTGSAVRHRATATLLEDAPPARMMFTEVPAARPVARARWTTPLGEYRDGEVPVPASTRAGTEVPVWLDASGAIAAPPADPLVPRLRGLATGTLVMMGGVVTALAAYGLFRWRVDRRRLREWDAAWLRTDQDGRNHRR